MIQKFDPGLEQKLETWLATHVGLELFKGGFDRLDSHFSTIKKSLKEHNVKIITIGGTNGKGQTSLLLEKELVESGLNVGLWTSPHILSVCERFRFNTQSIDQAELLTEFELLAQQKEKTSLSYYEFLFHIFLNWICKKEIDVLILEVGLGGRLDAVNFFDADLAAIVSIGRDHQEILGTSLKGILKEKMGICRSGTPVVTALEQRFLRDEIKKVANNMVFPWLDLHEIGWVDEETPYELSNALLAKVLGLSFKQKNFPNEKPKATLESIPEFKGRCEKMTLNDVRFIFIGAHNVDGMRKLTQSIVKQLGRCDFNSDSILWLSFSSRSDEEIETMFDIWEASGCLYKEIWVSPFDHPKAFDKDKLIKLVEKRKKGKIHFVLDWKKRIRELDSNENILVSGSYYFIGSVQRELLSLGGEGSLSV
jgi:dihydrofolate synthase / folylpolyglutamate synthase